MTQTPSSQPRPYLSYLLYLAISITAFFPSLFLGKAYFANDLLHQYSHFRSLLREQILSGHFPLWNPYFLGGQPFFADPNVMMCYPLNYLTLLPNRPASFVPLFEAQLKSESQGENYAARAAEHLLKN